MSNSNPEWHDPVAARTRRGKQGFVAPPPPAPVEPRRRLTGRAPSPTSVADIEPSTKKPTPPSKAKCGSKPILRAELVPDLDSSSSPVQDRMTEDQSDADDIFSDEYQPEDEDPDLPELDYDLDAISPKSKLDKSTFSENARVHRSHRLSDGMKLTVEQKSITLPFRSSSPLSSIEDKSSPSKPVPVRKHQLERSLILGSEIFSDDDEAPPSKERVADMTSDDEYHPWKHQRNRTKLFGPGHKIPVEVVISRKTSNERRALNPSSQSANKFAHRFSDKSARKPATKPLKTTVGGKISTEGHTNPARGTEVSQSPWDIKAASCVDKTIPLSLRLKILETLVEPDWTLKSSGETRMTKHQQRASQIILCLQQERRDEEVQARRAQLKDPFKRDNIPLGHSSMFANERKGYGRSDRITQSQQWIDERMKNMDI